MAAAKETADWSLVDFAKQVFGAKSSAAVTRFNFNEAALAEQQAAAAAAVADTEPAPETIESAASTAGIEAPAAQLHGVADQALPSPDLMPPTRQSRSSDEMAEIILNALRGVEGAPERGFVVTVYGGRPWNAMLTIKPEAGAVKDARLWRKRVQEIGAQLRRDFDVTYDQ
jgi:hypothetical protein